MKTCISIYYLPDDVIFYDGFSFINVGRERLKHDHMKHKPCHVPCYVSQAWLLKPTTISLNLIKIAVCHLMLVGVFNQSFIFHFTETSSKTLISFSALDRT